MGRPWQDSKDWKTPSVHPAGRMDSCRVVAREGIVAKDREDAVEVEHSMMHFLEGAHCRGDDGNKHDYPKVAQWPPEAVGSRPQVPRDVDASSSSMDLFPDPY